MSKPQRATDELRPPESAQDFEPVAVPKGQSRVRFLIILGLMVLTLVIFVVGDQVQGLFDKRAGDDAVLSWRKPGGSTEVISAADFQDFRMRLARTLAVLNTDGRRSRLSEEADVARLMIVDELARESGVEVSDAQVAKAILEGQYLLIGEGAVFVPPYGSTATFNDNVRGARANAREVTETLRMLMRVDRFELFLAFALAQPDPTTYAAEWKKAHQEYAYEFVAGDVAVTRLEVEQSVPAEADLKLWYDALPDKSRRFSAEWKQEQVSAEFAFWNFDGESEPVQLVANFVRPPETDLEQLAKDYYNLFANVRFRRTEEKADAANDQERLFLPYEEVADAARRESKIHAAFVDWQTAVAARIAGGEAVDLAVEAAGLGLAYRKEETPKTVAEWNALADFGGPLLTQKIMMAARGTKVIETFVGEKGLVAGRVLERVPAGAPPFEEVREKAASEWKTDKAVSVTEARMRALVDDLRAKPAEGAPPIDPNAPVVVDSATFAAKAQVANQEVVATGWFDPQALPTELPATPTLLDRFYAQLRVSPEYAAAAEGTVLPPRTSADRERVWVVRAAGKRDPEVVAIKPRDLEMLESQAKQAAEQHFRGEVISAKAFARAYELKFTDGRDLISSAPPN